MEAYGQKKYTVLTRNQILEKMTTEIDQLSEVFLVSKSDTTAILIRLKWNTFKASDRLGDDKEKFLAESGLVRVFDLNQSGSICLSEVHSQVDGGDHLVISTPFCSHSYCIPCWKDYFREVMEEKKDEERVILCCPHKDCVASIGPDTIEKFDETVKEMYERYVMESYMESKKDSIKWCPAEGCKYAVEVDEDVDIEQESYGLDVICSCGHILCWSCQQESHRPVTCKNASLWLNHLLDQSRSVAWIAENTKPCPNCNSAVEKDGDPDFRMLTCICSCSFCWRCFRSEEEHNGKWNCKEVVVPSSELTQNLNFSLWKEAQEDFESAKRDLKYIEEETIPSLIGFYGLNEQDQRGLREAWMLMVQCKLVLKWSCIFDYFTSEYQTAKKQYLNHLRDEARQALFRHREAVIKLILESGTSGNFSGFRTKLAGSTTITGNFFHNFVETLESGMPEVTVDTYANAPASYWLCARCTFQNIWSDRDCKTCCAPRDSPIPTLVLNNSATVSSPNPNIH